MPARAGNAELRILYAFRLYLEQIVAHKKSSPCPGDNMHLPHFVQKIRTHVQISAIRLPIPNEFGCESKNFVSIGIFFHKVARCVL